MKRYFFFLFILNVLTLQAQEKEKIFYLAEKDWDQSTQPVLYQVLKDKTQKRSSSWMDDINRLSVDSTFPKDALALESLLFDGERGSGG